MRIRVNKSVIIWVLPIAAGVIVGELLNTLDIDKTKSHPSFPSSPDKSLETSLPKKTPRSLTHYLLTSQTLFSQAIKLSQENQTAEKNDQIVRLINEAISQATAAITYYPDDPRSWAQRAKIYQAIEKYLKEGTKIALNDLKQAIRCDPTNPEYLKQASRLSLKLGLTQEAIFYLQQAAENSPTEAQLWLDLARLQSKTGNLVAARQNYRRLLPLLADENQKQLVEKELKAIDTLLAQTPNQSSPTNLPSPPPPAEKIILPENPPSLEARVISQNLIIAAPQKDDSLLEEGELTSNALSGNAVIPAGETEITIENENLTPQDQVYLAVLGESQNQVLRVKSKKEKSFTAAISQPLDKDLEFKWWIIK